ncbi:MAG: hypothetical protein UY18_C0048G0006 [Microgenomates group bacterium GW2011_GWF2_47_9]|nr:MAG: hypothetical protein UY18_C0048G0006 [Microgenomates group bacterium GW2011_GWF2_47_9]
MARRTEFKDRLQYLIDRKNISQSAFANEIGADTARVSDWLRGVTKKPQYRTIIKIAGFFGCNVDWLSGGTGEPFPKPDPAAMSQHIGSIGSVGGHVQQVHGDYRGEMPDNIFVEKRDAGKPVHRESSLADLRKIPILGRVPEDVTHILRENVETYANFPDAPANCFALKVRDEAMAPQISFGDYVLFVIDRRPNVGDIVVINDEYGDSKIRRLKMKGDEPELVSDNSQYEKYPLDTDHRIMGVVVGGWRPLKF